MPHSAEGDQGTLSAGHVEPLRSEAWEPELRRGCSATWGPRVPVTSIEGQCMTGAQRLVLWLRMGCCVAAAAGTGRSSPAPGLASLMIEQGTVTSVPGVRPGLACDPWGSCQWSPQPRVLIAGQSIATAAALPWSQHAGPGLQAPSGMRLPETAGIRARSWGQWGWGHALLSSPPTS